MSRRLTAPGLAGMVGTASLLALLPLAVTGSAPAAASEEFSLPSGPLVLTRTLRRPLPDGAEIVSTRRYEIRIAPNGEGYRVEGRLLSAEVIAPPSLATLAEIERKRSDAGLFPIRLDRQGMIALSVASVDRGAAAEAVAAAHAAIANSTLAERERRDAQEAIAKLAAPGGASGARWPSDLFRPTPGLRNQTSRFEIGAGETGSVITTIETQRSTSTHSIKRTVVTEAGGTRRATHEIYTVSPLEG